MLRRPADRFLDDGGGTRIGLELRLRLGVRLPPRGEAATLRPPIRRNADPAAGAPHSPNTPLKHMFI